MFTGPWPVIELTMVTICPDLASSRTLATTGLIRKWGLLSFSSRTVIFTRHSASFRRLPESFNLINYSFRCKYLDKIRITFIKERFIVVNCDWPALKVHLGSKLHVIYLSSNEQDVFFLSFIIKLLYQCDLSRGWILILGLHQNLKILRQTTVIDGGVDNRLIHHKNETCGISWDSVVRDQFLEKKCPSNSSNCN